MAASTSSRCDGLNTIVLLLVVAIAVNAAIYVPDSDSKIAVQAIMLLTSQGMYRFFIKLIFWVINNSDIALRMYWGKIYIKGLWSYEYILDNKLYFGVWDIQQDVNNTSLVGNGLDDNFMLRTIVRSISPLIEESGGYFFINSRNEMNNNNAQVFSKTTLLLDRPKGMLKGVTSMRGITVVYGGPSDRQLHPNVIFHRHDDVDSIEALIAKMKTTSVWKDDLVDLNTSNAVPKKIVSMCETTSK